MISRVFVVAVAVMMTACARYDPVDSTTVGPDYVTGGGKWNTGGGITTAVDIHEGDGATIVCGAWTTDPQSVLTYNRNEEVMEVASVYAGGTRLVQNLSFMARVPYSQNISGERANCVRSSVPWRPEFSETGPHVRIPRFVDTEVADEPGEGGSMVVFRETARPDIVN